MMAFLNIIMMIIIKFSRRLVMEIINLNFGVQKVMTRFQIIAMGETVVIRVASWSLRKAKKFIFILVSIVVTHLPQSALVRLARMVLVVVVRPTFVTLVRIIRQRQQNSNGTLRSVFALVLWWLVVVLVL